MAYLIMRSGSMQHPPFTYPTFEEAHEAAAAAVVYGFYERSEPDLLREGESNKLFFQLGPGSVIWVMSEEAFTKQTRQAEAQQRARQGLISAAEDPQGAFKVVIQIPGQVEPPFGFETREQAEQAVRDALERGHITYLVEPGLLMTVMTGPGAILMVMSDEHYKMQRRKAIEAAMQQAQMQRAMQAGAGKLILPSS